MKLMWFHLMPYTDLPDDFPEKYPSVWVDIAATLGRKVEALRAHASQLRKPQELEAMIRSWAEEDGRRAGSAAAESFRLVQLG